MTRICWLQLVNTTVEDVSLKERLPYDVVLGVIERRIATQVDWARYTPWCSGSGRDWLKKGHRDLVVIVTAVCRMDTSRFWGVPDREKARSSGSCKAFRLTWARRFIPCARIVRGLSPCGQEVLLHVRIVIDRFHVAQKYRDAADTVPEAKLKRLKQELRKPTPTLKAVCGPSAKTPRTWHLKSKSRLARLFAYSPELKRLTFCAKN